MPRKHCSVFVRGEEIYVATSAKSVSGIYQDIEPIFKLRQEQGPHELGEKLLAALQSYREGVPDRLYRRGVKFPASPFLLATHFTSWRAFEEGARYFSVDDSDDEIEIIPSM